MEAPGWMLHPEKRTLKTLRQELRERGLRSSFPRKEEAVRFVTETLGWPYRMPWREEQTQMISGFLYGNTRETVFQAIFGAGKTTMMLAILYHQILHDPSCRDKVFVCAYNVGIRNEIRKKLAPLRGIEVRTYDSLIWHCARELGYKDLHLLNFETKRRFVRENTDRLVPRIGIRLVLVDESQDLERPCLTLLRHVFPEARFLYVGDVFQSIQKEPRESLLWHLLDDGDEALRGIGRFRMMVTPRVPNPILGEIKTALTLHYPEHESSIRTWTSSSTADDARAIRWVPFAKYGEVYRSLLEEIRAGDPTKIMILTFSSAITVRGSLGDIARFRKHFTEHGVRVNPNHKRMLDDRLFLSTANSSKGLERERVFCVLTFPLELAFANFSDDLVMNLCTVALSRCKKECTFFVPTHDDRFSRVLERFASCPRPTVRPPAPVSERVVGPRKETNSFVYDPTDLVGMLEKEHSCTEVLRQSILSFETRDRLRRLAHPVAEHDLGEAGDIPLRTEEECTFAGILFESLILSLWNGRFPASGADQIQHHELFSESFGTVAQMSRAYRRFVRQHPIIRDERTRFTGCHHFAQLQLYAHQKILVRADTTRNHSLFRRWIRILPTIRGLPVGRTGEIKTQVNVSMECLKGIMDASRVNGENKDLEIFEIKASRSPEWREMALLQAILYGVMSARVRFRVWIINVFSSKARAYDINLQKTLMDIRGGIARELLCWNLGCYLAKNPLPGATAPMRLSEIVTMDTDKTGTCVCEFVGATRCRMTFWTTDDSLLEHLRLLQRVYGVRRIIVPPSLLSRDDLPIPVSAVEDFVPPPKAEPPARVAFLTAALRQRGLV